MRIVMAGCGALGSRIAIELANPEWDFILIDDDVVGEENIGTSAYSIHHVGMKKAVALAEMMYHKNQAHAYTFVETLEGHVVHYIKLYRYEAPRTIIVDSFDNPRARNCTIDIRSPSYNTLHVGISASREGSVIWDHIYPEPSIDFERGLNEICTNHLGQQIIQFTASVASGVILNNDENSYIVRENMEVIRL
jgi:molybdopterin/thiamine biosynthesis adenylyltransferase